MDETLSWLEGLAARWKQGFEHNAFSIHDFRHDVRTFEPERVRQMWVDLLEAEPQAPVSLYVHALLCPTRCLYCQCTAKAVTSRDEREALVEALIREAAYLAPVFEHVAFVNGAFGGGTPNIFTTPQFERLLEGVYGRFQLAPGAQNHVEFNPANTTPEKLRLALAHGLNQLSFGVETLTPHVLRAYDRGYQRTGTVARAIESARQAGYDDIAADLVLLSGETAATWRNTVDELCQMGPTHLELSRYRPMPGETKARAALGDGEWLSQADGYAIFREVAEAHGYLVTPDYSPEQLAFHAVKADFQSAWSVQEVYAENPLNGVSVLGIGAGARSICSGQAVYSNRGQSPGFAPVYRGSLRSRRDDARAFLLSVFSDNRSFGLRQFAEAFGGELGAMFPASVDLIERHGWARVVDDQLTWSCEDLASRKALALALGGALERREAFEAWLCPPTPRGSAPSPPGAALPSWLSAGPLAGTAWQVAGPWEGGRGFVRLVSPEGAELIAEVFEAKEGAPAFRVDNGWGVSYRGAHLPDGGAEALVALLRRAPAK